MTMPLMSTLRLTAVICIAVFSVLLLGGSAGAVRKDSLLSDATLELIPVVSKGLQSPLFLTQVGDGTGQLFIVEQLAPSRAADVP